ncbi:MAG: hypothetical protein WBA74_16615 [Cyclobacteriaceae bacterium]
MVLIQIAFIVTFLYLGFRLLRFCYRKVRSLMHDHGINSLASFLSLGISATFFYQTFEAFIVNIGGFITQTIKSVTVFTGSIGDKEATDVLTNNVLDSFSALILTLPFISILLFCVVWVFIAIILQSFLKGQETDTTKGFSNIFASVQWRYTVFGVLIVFGIFFSIASIIAVPVFQEDQSQGLTTEGLQIGPELNNYLPDSALFFHKYEITTDTTIKGLRAKYVASGLENWNDRVSSVYQMILQNKDQAIGRFNIAKEEKLTEDAKIDYMQELIQWFLSSKTILLNNLNTDRPEVNAEITHIYLADSLKISNATYMERSLLSLQSTAKHLELTEIPAMPALPSVSAGYGIFGWMAGWILQTNNLAFALIVGMIGFGVFGATISHIILETTDATQPVVFTSIDYLKLLIRGFSAAIVIYLAAKGGLLIVSGSEASLNAYFIFFMCFVAAIFSEVVWNWVKEKLVSSLNSSK